MKRAREADIDSSKDDDLDAATIARLDKQVDALRRMSDRGATEEEEEELPGQLERLSRRERTYVARKLENDPVVVDNVNRAMRSRGISPEDADLVTGLGGDTEAQVFVALRNLKQLVEELVQWHESGALFLRPEIRMRLVAMSPEMQSMFFKAMVEMHKEEMLPAVIHAVYEGRARDKPMTTNEQVAFILGNKLYGLFTVLAEFATPQEAPRLGPSVVKQIQQLSYEDRLMLEWAEGVYVPTTPGNLKGLVSRIVRLAEAEDKAEKKKPLSEQVDEAIAKGLDPAQPNDMVVDDGDAKA